MSADIEIGDRVETTYGEGIVHSVQHETITVFISGRGQIRVKEGDIVGGSNTASSDTNAPEEESDTTSTSSDGNEVKENRETTKTASSEVNRTRPSSNSTSAPATDDRKGSDGSVHAEEKAVKQNWETQDGEVSTEDTPQERHKAALEALRLGTVPQFAIDQITIGRDEEREVIRDAALETENEGKGRCMLISGPNGSGKTHLLSLTEEDLVSRGFVTARANLEGAIGITPKDVYREAVRDMRWSSSGNSCSGTLENFVHAHWDQFEQFSAEKFIDVPIIRGITDLVNRKEVISREIWDFILGNEQYAKKLEETPLKSTHMPYWRSAGQCLGNFFNGFAYLCQELGFSGFSLLIDEAELVLNQDIDDALQGREWLRGLIMSVKGGSFTGSNGTEFSEYDTSRYKTWKEFPGMNLQKRRFEYKIRYGGVDPERKAMKSSYGIPFAPLGNSPFLLCLGYTKQHMEGATVFDEGTGYSDSWLPEDMCEDRILELELPIQQDIEQLIDNIARLYKEAYPEERELVDDSVPEITSTLVERIDRRISMQPGSALRWATQCIAGALDRLNETSVDQIRQSLS